MSQRDRIPPERFSSPWSRGEGWDFFGCRHGLALLICRKRGEAVVWDPLTGHQRRVEFPPGLCQEDGKIIQNAAVMCAAASAQDGHVHGDCRFTPFRLALVGSGRGSDGAHNKSACIYDSESGAWGDIVSVDTAPSMCVKNASVLVRDAFCWMLSGGDILQFDFQSQSLAVTKRPADPHATHYYWSSFVLRTEHGGMGLAVLSKSEYGNMSIKLWERKSNCDAVAGWELQKTIQLDGQATVMLQGYDEDSNSIFLSTFFGDYMIQLWSTQLIELFKLRRHVLDSRTYYPYRNFYIEGSEVGGQDGGAEM